MVFNDKWKRRDCETQRSVSGSVNMAYVLKMKIEFLAQGEDLDKSE